MNHILRNMNSMSDVTKDLLCFHWWSLPRCLQFELSKVFLNACFLRTCPPHRLQLSDVLFAEDANEPTRRTFKRIPWLFSSLCVVCTTPTYIIIYLIYLQFEGFRLQCNATHCLRKIRILRWIFSSLTILWSSNKNAWLSTLNSKLRMDEFKWPSSFSWSYKEINNLQIKAVR